MSPHQLALRYAVFAAVATASNVLAQMAVFAVMPPPQGLWPAILVGTLVGLVVKYQLDQRYIFRFKARSASHAGTTFLRYTATGVFTTLIFWGFELGAQWLFDTAVARYAGAVIGLALGYWLKYRLDKQHVFREPSPC